MCWLTVLVAGVIMNETYIDINIITALLPLSALMLVFQVNPYHALVIRGILGAVAALVYAILGAADVALTEALVGTMLSITLYAVAVRSSLVMRLGVLTDGSLQANEDNNFNQLINEFRIILNKHHMRVLLVPYTNSQALQRALMEKEVHATCARQLDLEEDELNHAPPEAEKQPYNTTTRLRRIYEIMETELTSLATNLTYVNTPDSGEKH
jgi:putative multicomponent Na+:H+ antiporter subunit B